MNADQIKVGDVIMPPAREVKLWMRRYVAERGLPESALYLTVVRIDEGSDKQGKWLHLEAAYSPEWGTPIKGNKPWPMRFKARPATEWPVIKGAL